MAERDSVIDWLMGGDPVIRWQTMRDLSSQSKDVWQVERQRIVQDGWGARFLERLRPDGTWPAGRWTDTVWTLLTLIECGLPPDHLPLHDAAQRFLDRHLTPERAGDEKWLLHRMDLCHLGFWLRIGSYYLGNDERLVQVAQTVLGAQMSDGDGTVGTAITRKHTIAHFTPRSTCLKGWRSPPRPEISLRRRFTRVRSERSR